MGLQSQQILIVEDELRIRNLLRLYLEREGFEVDEATTGEIGLEKALRYDYDLLILDVIQGFESGADDYVTKPFSPREVVHRIRSVVRRRQAGNHENLTFYRRLKLRDFTLEDDHKLSSRGKEIHLTPKEYELLFYLATSPDKLFSRENILQNVWNYDYSVDYRTVDTHIKRVREKVDDISAGSSSMIKTIWGLGYKFEID